MAISEYSVICTYISPTPTDQFNIVALSTHTAERLGQFTCPPVPRLEEEGVCEPCDDGQCDDGSL